MATVTFDNCLKGAVKTSYRYELWRIWDEQKPLMLFIGLNPSDGDELKDDPTIIKLKSFVRTFDNSSYGGFYIGNLFGFVTSKPRQLMKSKEPIGEDNNRHLISMASKCKTIVCIWGEDGALNRRDRDIVELLKERTLYCFETTKEGNPIHPGWPSLKYPKNESELKEFKLVL